ncbi:hypothetical protein CHS0354_027304 [Potamilus streckersoni]|uniref:Uncharacterized protein n=1 Tax=Potamilus streckersoni TaxID=2493646 RepID=A0AAE0TFX4_9BIVA|nr:hypothetical protein CHS0354_027304 [Potamilus streckersoni]
MKCRCVTAAENAESARRRDLISYNDLKNTCPTVPGSYWIGMFRESPVPNVDKMNSFCTSYEVLTVYSSTALTTPLTSTSPLPSSSTQPRFQSSYKISQSVGNIISRITQTSSGYQTRNVTTTSLYTEGTSYHEGTIIIY